jgi:hypothetical protein
MADAPGIPRYKYFLGPTRDYIIFVYDTKSEDLQDGHGNVHTEYTRLAAHEYHVSRNMLEQLPYFRDILGPGGSQATSTEHVVDDEDDPAAWKLLLCIIHDCSDGSDLEVGTLVMWNLIDLAVKYGLNLSRDKPKAWFVLWYTQHKRFITTRQCRELMYLALRFNHAEAFARVTKQLAYNVPGHIEELMPEGFEVTKREHRLPTSHMIGMSYYTATFSAITDLSIGALNGVRSSLRNKLHANLYEPINRLLTAARCKSKKDNLWAYESALHKSGVWPLESEAKDKSINELLRLLYDDFKYEDPHPKAPDGRCTDRHDCGHDFEHVVNSAINKARDQFNGLCLGISSLSLSMFARSLANPYKSDCMRASSIEAEDEDYWRHAETGYYRSRGICRVSHGQPTWYFSFMGRKERQTKRMAGLDKLKMEEDERVFKMHQAMDARHNGKK